jgi:hypothetical protein
MSKFGIFLGLSLTSGLFASQVDSTLRPIGTRLVSLSNVALVNGDRVEEVELVVRGASFDSVRIPLDWNFDVEAPISGVANLKASAAHGVGMPFTFGAFRRFATLAIYDYGEWNAPLNVTGSVTVLNDGKERILQLKQENIILEKPNQSKDSAP